MASAENVTVVGRSAVFHGTLTRGGNVQIDGVLEGRVDVPSARITTDSEGKMKAEQGAQDRHQ